MYRVQRPCSPRVHGNTGMSHGHYGNFADILSTSFLTLGAVYRAGSPQRTTSNPLQMHSNSAQMVRARQPPAHALLLLQTATRAEIAAHSKNSTASLANVPTAFLLQSCIGSPWASTRLWEPSPGPAPHGAHPVPLQQCHFSWVQLWSYPDPTAAQDCAEGRRQPDTW